MTWYTPNGRRCLQGPEADLLRESLSAVWEQVEEDLANGDDVAPWTYGVTIFDNLPLPSRLAMLATVGWGLLRETEVCPELTALNEAVVAALYENVIQSIGIEVDLSADAEEDFRDWRRLTVAAVAPVGDLEDLPAASCADLSEWECLVGCLSDRVLWDADYEDGGRILDSPPEVASEIRDFFGIDEDYFLDVPPDPREPQLSLIRDKLKTTLRLR